MMDINNLELIIELIQNNDNLQTIRKKIIDYHPYDLAIVLTKLDKENRLKIAAVFTNEELADIFAYLDEVLASEYLSEMNINQAAAILGKMEVDDAADILSEMENEGDAYLDIFSTEDKDELNALIEHGEDTAGSIMNTNYIKLEVGMDVRDAMRTMIKSASESEIIDPLFVCENDKLVGVIDLKELIIARSPKQIGEIMNTNLIMVDITENTNIAIKKIKDYDLFALPVIEDGKMVGIITVDDIVDEFVDHFIDDYGKMAGVTADIDEEKKIIRNVLNRLPWLVGLLIISLVISNITKKFENVIKEVTLLAFFQTMILDMAGNIGTQGLAVTVRGIGNQELKNRKDVFKHLLKELRITLINSIILGFLAFFVCYLFIIIRNDSTIVAWVVALIIAGSMTLALIVTGLLGSIVPLIFHRLKFDPAVASGPLITTLNDIVAIVIYFGLASLFMNAILK